MLITQRVVFALHRFLWARFQQMAFAEIHFMTLNHFEEFAWLTASRVERVTVFMDNYYV